MGRFWPRHRPSTPHTQPPGSNTEHICVCPIGDFSFPEKRREKEKLFKVVWVERQHFHLRDEKHLVLKPEFLKTPPWAPSVNVQEGERCPGCSASPPNSASFQGALLGVVDFVFPQEPPAFCNLPSGVCKLPGSLAGRRGAGLGRATEGSPPTSPLPHSRCREVCVALSQHISVLARTPTCPPWHVRREVKVPQGSGPQATLTSPSF